MAKKTYFTTCQRCGANLDPNETCDCTSTYFKKLENEPKNVLYVCDRRACVRCSPECQHTRDISHAASFELDIDFFVEKER